MNDVLDTESLTQKLQLQLKLWKVCERLPLVPWCHCSCSQYPRLRRAVSSDCDRRKPHHYGVWVQWHPAPQLGLEEGWWDHQTGSNLKCKSGLQHVTTIPKQPCSHLSGSELKPDQRLRVLSGGRQLQISSAARTDTASYSCTASSASGVTSKEYSLQVYGTLEPPYLYHLILKFIYFIIFLFSYPLQLAPSRVFLISVRPSIKHSTRVTDDVAVTKGGNVTLQCAAEGIPRPAVTWLKDGRPLSGHQRAKILNEGRLLQIRNVKVSDTGRYTCTAVNVAGQADSRHDISVHGVYCLFIIIVVVVIMIILYYKLFMSLIPSLASPTNYYRSGRSAWECECSCEESNSSELRGLWHPSSCHQLVERWSSSQSFRLSSRPLRWLLSDPVAFLLHDILVIINQD